jgi:hypothetical protein
LSQNIARVDHLAIHAAFMQEFFKKRKEKKNENKAID